MSTNSEYLTRHIGDAIVTSLRSNLRHVHNCVKSARAPLFDVSPTCGTKLSSICIMSEACGMASACVHASTNVNERRVFICWCQMASATLTDSSTYCMRPIVLHINLIASCTSSNGWKRYSHSRARVSSTTTPSSTYFGVVAESRRALERRLSIL